MPKKITPNRSYAHVTKTASAASSPRVETPTYTHNSSTRRPTRHEEASNATFLDKTRAIAGHIIPQKPIKCILITLLVLILLIVIIAAILYFGFWVGVPTVNVLGVLPPTGDSQNFARLDLSDPPSLTILANVRVEVINPNKLDLSFATVDVQAFHPQVSGVQIGQAQIKDLVLPKKSPTSFIIPLALKYNLRDDPNQVIANDLMTSCTKVNGTAVKQLQFDLKLNIVYKLTDVIKFNLPVIENSPSFDCPVDAQKAFNINGNPINLLKIDWKAASLGQLSLKN